MVNSLGRKTMWKGGWGGVKEMEEWDETGDEGEKRMKEWIQYMEKDFLSVTADRASRSFSKKIKYWSISQAY